MAQAALLNLRGREQLSNSTSPVMQSTSLPSIPIIGSSNSYTAMPASSSLPTLGPPPITIGNGMVLGGDFASNSALNNIQQPLLVGSDFGQQGVGRASTNAAAAGNRGPTLRLPNAPQTSYQQHSPAFDQQQF
jgi:hypothetical protein